MKARVERRVRAVTEGYKLMPDCRKQLRVTFIREVKSMGEEFPRAKLSSRARREKWALRMLGVQM